LKILITGGAGFIGSRLALSLSEHAHEVTIIDNLSEQVHGSVPGFAENLLKSARCIKGDVRNPELLEHAIDGQNVIIHLAAETGTAQSMYSVKHYSDVNIQGTAGLMDLLINRRPAALRKLIVASSRSIYGEGKYICPEHRVVYPKARLSKDMEAGCFDPKCPLCGGAVEMSMTSEDAPFAPSSFYGLSKQVQEQMVLLFAQTLGIDAFALRYQNVFGPGQSLANPYTGILAIFSNLIRQSKPLNIFEDGLESRDFVFVDDVVSATEACVRDSAHGVMALNVGSGVATSVLTLARMINERFGSPSEIRVTGDFRVGDIRHNVADISNLQAVTGFRPKWEFRAGLNAFLDWAETQSVISSGFERSLAELADRGLLGGRA
jgi:dTDP-L-rhamnose 4-epimerase